jgi:hypothetical protein
MDQAVENRRVLHPYSYAQARARHSPMFSWTISA